MRFLRSRSDQEQDTRRLARRTLYDLVKCSLVLRSKDLSRREEVGKKIQLMRAENRRHALVTTRGDHVRVKLAPALAGTGGNGVSAAAP